MRSGVVLGLGGNVDFEVVWDAESLDALTRGFDIYAGECEATPRIVEDERGMLVALLHAIRHQKGMEVRVVDPQALRSFAERFTYTMTLGGTSVRAAVCLDRLGVGSLVHLVSTCEELRSLLPERVSSVSSAREDSLDPHVIVQYPAAPTLHFADGSPVWEAPEKGEGGHALAAGEGRPNRVIFVNDPANERMKISPDLGEAISTAKVVVISGLNAMTSEELLARRLDTVERMLAQAPSEQQGRDCMLPPPGFAGRPVIYEEAGFHHEHLRQQVLASARRWATIHSMNEDEAQHYLGRKANMTEAEDLVSLMKSLRVLSGVRNVVVHTADYAAVIGEDAPAVAKAAALGCQMASTRFAHGDGFTAEDFHAMAAVPYSPVGLYLTASPAVRKAGVLIAPSHAVKIADPTTIGLGDAFVGGMVLSLSHERG
ncbi:ADP-dependent glucokinase/phosphofructokinase [Schaalia sp. Marseille-Q2122]|uniref:ADP-dependent glucokinase/phosphofructokinase n=1 Tax=Schaalia sp. Marseille-Q2122 TaxID=2736604 RepID=UPI001589C750|nr:ADP-dependent glucokinase/phosphofructokinase [Schaalia sp. Marseille-Q2122]